MQDKANFEFDHTSSLQHKHNLKGQEESRKQKKNKMLPIHQWTKQMYHNI
jgi:hypothetical protein